MTVAEAVATSSDAVEKYSWRDGARLPAGLSPQVVGSEIATVYSLVPRPQAPSMLVERARPEDSPLHPAFEWDDSIAAEQHRIYQARQLCNSVRIIRQGVLVPAFVHVTIAATSSAPKQEGYVPLDVALADRGWRNQVLAEAAALLNGLRQRMVGLHQVQPVVVAVDQALAAVQAAREVEAPPATE